VADGKKAAGSGSLYSAHVGAAFGSTSFAVSRDTLWGGSGRGLGEEEKHAGLEMLPEYGCIYRDGMSKNYLILVRCGSCE
jgi:hypothetical protein